MLTNYQVLIAEDEAAILETVRQGLEALLPDAAFLPAENGIAAVEAARQSNELHMAFLDIKMPLMDGLDAARHILERHSHCQIVFISAFSDFAFMQKALNLGAVNYLLKPFTQTELASAVQKALRQLENYANMQKSTSQIQTQTKRISRLADSQLLLNIVNGQQSPEAIRSHLKQMDIHFQRGIFAILHCPKGVSAKRIGGLLRGSDWGGSMKSFLYEQQSHIFILAVTSLPQRIAPVFSENILALCQKVKQRLRCQLSYAIGEEFTQLSAAQKSCFLCYYQLIQGLPFQIFPYNDTAPDELPTSTREYLNQMLAFLDCANLLGLRPSRVSRNILLSVPAVSAALGVPGKKLRAVEQSAEDLLRPCTDFTGLSAACQALSALIEQYATLKMMQGMNREDTREVIVSYIDTHYGEDITLESAADAMQYSPAYFGKLFKRLFEQTFTSYLVSVRMEHAKQYLTSSAASVREIAGLVGFNDSAYFTSAFRRMVGCTPTEFRSEFLQAKARAGAGGEEPL